MKRLSGLLVMAMVAMSCTAKTPEDKSYSPGQIVPEEYVAAKGPDTFFSAAAVPDSVFSLMKGKSFKDDCTVPRESLRYLLCLHRDIDGRILVGEMVVAERIANDVLEILRELYDNSYPIERMRLVDCYDADDESSMSDNNSSAFNFRFISHSTKVSKHGLGIAVDINPLYNPYYKVLKDGRESIEPANSAPYLDRSKDFKYKITKDDLCCRLFEAHGFEWGGDWTSCKDYQHFELTTE